MESSSTGMGGGNVEDVEEAEARGEGRRRLQLPTNTRKNNLKREMRSNYKKLLRLSRELDTWTLYLEHTSDGERDAASKSERTKGCPFASLFAAKMMRKERRRLGRIVSGHDRKSLEYLISLAYGHRGRVHHILRSRIEAARMRTSKGGGCQSSTSGAEHEDKCLDFPSPLLELVKFCESRAVQENFSRGPTRRRPLHWKMLCVNGYRSGNGARGTCQ